IEIVFRNNLFKLGDTYWRQVSGTGMGICPAPPYATITYGLHESKTVPLWQDQILFYKRFIDDIFGIWLMDPDPTLNQERWNGFKQAMQEWNGLEWVFSDLQGSVNFMDLTITIRGPTLHTTLFEKAQNLYLYLPPHSSHPKGVFTGLIFGKILRIRRLCTDKADADAKVVEFLHQLLARGHTRNSLQPLFHKAEANAAAYLARTPAEHATIRQQKLDEGSSQLYFHLQYHPEDPKAREIQELWREFVSHPAGQPPSAEMCDLDRNPCGIDKLVVAYHRPLNLRNRFSVRDIHGRGRPVSEYLAE
ncbi:MAG: hypothetical protein ACO3PI_07545, partial [Burkholderiaceae bacterium]